MLQSMRDFFFLSKGRKCWKFQNQVSISSKIKIKNAYFYCAVVLYFIYTLTQMCNKYNFKNQSTPNVGHEGELNEYATIWSS